MLSTWETRCWVKSTHVTAGFAIKEALLVLPVQSASTDLTWLLGISSR